MYSFLFRKTIFDAWDNVLSFFLANFGYLWLFALEFFWLHLNATGKLDLPPCVLLMVLTMIAISFYSMLTAVFAHNILTGKKRGQVLEGAGNIIRTHIGHIFFHAFISLVICINAFFAIPFYIRMGGFMGPLFAFIGLFLSLFLIFNFKYYLPLCLISPDTGVLDAIKYSFAYALDNKGTTAVLMLRSLMDLLISVPFLTLVPGFTGILISDTLAAMLLNKRYVMAEERETEKSAVPWSDVLETMNQKRYMSRKFISLLFAGR